MSRKKTDIYCDKCGTVNSKSDKRCKKCHKKLNTKNIMFFSFLSGHLKLDALDYASGSLFDFLKGFLMNYSFGIIFTVSVIFAGTSTYYNYVDSNNDDVVVISKRIEVKSNDTCIFEKVADMIYKCDKGYTLNGTVCEKSSKEDAKQNKVCESGYTLSKNQCISNETSEVIETPSCVIPDNYSNVIIGSSQDDKFTVLKEHIYRTKVDTNKKTCYFYWCDNPKLYDDSLDACVSGRSGYDVDPSLYKVVKSCKSGFEIVDGVCKKVLDAKTEYTCSNGELVGKKCFVTTTVDAKYECPDGYSYNDECSVCVGGYNE